MMKSDGSADAYHLINVDAVIWAIVLRCSKRIYVLLKSKQRCKSFRPKLEELRLNTETLRPGPSTSEISANWPSSYRYLVFIQDLLHEMLIFFRITTASIEVRHGKTC